MPDKHDPVPTVFAKQFLFPYLNLLQDIDKQLGSSAVHGFGFGAGASVANNIVNSSEYATCRHVYVCRPDGVQSFKLTMQSSKQLIKISGPITGLLFLYAFASYLST